jgi:hypothetical protein
MVGTENSSVNVTIRIWGTVMEIAHGALMNSRGLAVDSSFAPLHHYLC